MLEAQRAVALAGRMGTARMAALTQGKFSRPADQAAAARTEAVPRLHLLTGAPRAQATTNRLITPGGAVLTLVGGAPTVVTPDQRFGKITGAASTAFGISASIAVALNITAEAA